MTERGVQIPPADRLGLSRVQVAEYIGVPVMLFDLLVSDRRMPPPRRFSEKVLVWDREEVREAFKEIPHAAGGRPRRAGEAVRDPFVDG